MIMKQWFHPEELKKSEEHLLDYQFVKNAKNDFNTFKKVLLTNIYWSPLLFFNIERLPIKPFIEKDSNL